MGEAERGAAFLKEAAHAIAEGYQDQVGGLPAPPLTAEEVAELVGEE